MCIFAWFRLAFKVKGKAGLAYGLGLLSASVAADDALCIYVTILH